MATHAATAAAACNDETARLYGKYGRQLYRYCLARLRSPEEAEDAVQNTFIRVHGALGKGVTPRFEAAWLYKIAHNVCLTRSEINVRRAHHEQPTDFGEVELAAPEPTDRLEGLEEALASMPKNLRDPILLREWQGLSYAEIAESLDTSVSAVETLIFRARRHLVATLRPVLDLGLAYSSVRVLLARLRGVATAAGPAKVAVGAAAIAIGGAGVSTAVTVAGDKPPHRHSPAVQAPAPVLVNATPAPKPVAHSTAAPAVKATTVATVVSASRSSTVTSVSPSSAATPVAAPTASTPVATTPDPVPTPTPTVTTPSLPTPTVIVPVTLPVVPTTIELPSVTTPVVTTPAVTVELPSLPSPSLPTVQTPTLPVTVSVPTLP